MGCKTIQEMLPAYQDGELNTLEMREIEEHLLTCESCRNVNIELKEAWQVLEIWDDVDVPERSRKTGVSRLSKQRRVYWPKIVLPVAAALVIVFGMTLKFAGMKNEEQMQMPLSAPAQLSAEYPDVDEDELIADLHILQDEEFYDSLEELVKIDYLPLVDEPKHQETDKERSSLDVVLT
jgi:hypothetical protein